MSPFTHFTIRLCRDVNVADHDDVITVKPRWNKLHEECQLLEYVVKHRVAPCSAPDDTSIITEQVLFGSNLSEYIRNLVDLLEADIHPFKQIQFDFPCMPSIVIAPSQISTVHDAIMSTVHGLQETWPTQVVKKIDNKCSRSLNANAEPFFPESFRSDERNNHESFRTPQRPTSAAKGGVAPPPSRPARHIFFDEEDGHVTRYFY